MKNVLDIIKNEKACVERASLPFGCDRKCEECDLLMDSDDIIKAYETVMTIIEELEELRNVKICIDN